MVLRLPARIIRCLRSLATWVIGFSTIYTIFSALKIDTNVWRRASHKDSVQAACITRVGQGIAGLDDHLRPHVTLDRPSSPFPRLLATPSLPLHCLDEWIAQGKHSCKGRSAGSDLKLDIVWTWVNGSDVRWKDAMRRASQEEGVFSPGFHFRDQNELRYSVRSVLEALPGSIETCHLIVADYPYNHTTDQRLETEALASVLPSNRSMVRVAQIPHWLDFAKIGCRPTQGSRDPIIQLVTHSDIFHLPSDGSPGETDLEEEWRQKALPSFNSKAIESRIGWVPGLAEVVVSFNDDFFLLKPHSTSDFYSLHLGTVIRFDEGFYQQVRPVLSRKNINDAGETGGLWHANWLLSKRFPKRLRPYLPHVPKVVTRGLHHEAALMFKDDLFHSTQRRFRESTHGEGDIQLQWLLISLRVERWREALLWTFVVANIGNLRDDGRVGSSAKTRLANLLGSDTEVVIGQLEVIRGKRKTLGSMEEVWQQSGLHLPQATEMLFSCMDGHLPPIPRPGMPASSTDHCALDLDGCFGPFWSGDGTMLAADLFTRVTFERPDCGDCLIMALVKASGTRGLSAFLPDSESCYKPAARTSTSAHGPASSEKPPILPLTNTWQAADFSLESVLQGYPLEHGRVPLRSWTLRLLSRYLYVTGRSASQFHMIASPSSAIRACEAINNDDSASMLGLNDNILYESDETRVILTRWFNKRWPEQGWWERSD